MNALELFVRGDAITRTVSLLLLAMSVASWVVILWKVWLLGRASADVRRCVTAFWQSAALDDAGRKVQAFDRHRLIVPLIQAAGAEVGQTLAGTADKGQQLTRVLRDALHGTVSQLQYGQILLATVGSTAPFVGLLGTVWGIYHALIGIAHAGQVTVEKISGPVGEALIMTAAGLAVAIPAVLAYNVMGHRIGRLQTQLESFTFDLRELLLGVARPGA